MFKMTCFNTLNSWGEDYKSQVTGHSMKCLSLHWLQIFKSSQAQQPISEARNPQMLASDLVRRDSPSSEPCLDIRSLL